MDDKNSTGGIADLRITLKIGTFLKCNREDAARIGNDKAFCKEIRDSEYRLFIPSKHAFSCSVAIADGGAAGGRSMIL